MSLRTRALVVAGMVSLWWPASAAAQDSKEDLAPRATQYVEGFLSGFSSIVAEEHYVQEDTTSRRRRELKSDFLLVKVPGSGGLNQFRDVFEVDGKPVRDRDERLVKLFVEPRNDAMAQAAEIARESARHNLQNIGVLSEPLTALGFLQAQYVQRFRLTSGSIDKKVGPTARIIKFDQQPREFPYLRGRYWIDEETARVLKTELQFGALRIPDEVITVFGFDEDLQMMVPLEKRETYSTVSGKATYGRFRRFEVKTEEEFR
jgi:hypothetical protein